ncbi:PEP-CTERM sorting domain-containing protein [Rubritalea marina]|uniref:PEP-CTERM sorting domain-containing protein n=1 Tax=Rubritalea marina TaxID=361055 RepID=UPI0003801EAA|nr:PEP-CTERM sorting domain-containing protein [Rubritalea marina]
MMKKLIPTATLLVSASIAQAASLVQTTLTLTDNENDTPPETYVSVKSGAEYYGGTIGGSVSQTAFNSPVQGYSFFNAGGGSSNEYATSGGYVSNITLTDVSGTGQKSYINLYTTNNPNVSGTFDGTANFSSHTDAVARMVTGEVDVSSFTSGSVYFFFGTFQDAARVTATLSGSGGPDIVIAGDDLTTTGYAMTQFDFDTSGGYDTLSFEYLNDDNDATPGSRARFSGLVITAVPEPTSASLLSIGMTTLLIRRRR